MAFARVCSLDDVWQGEMSGFEVGGKSILIVHTSDGDVIATQNVCPHQEVELAEGELNGCVLTCKMHLWQFDVKTGKGINPGHAELALYPVKVEGDDVFVDVDAIEPKFAHS